MADERNRVDALEVASAVVLSISALASSWASYQAGLWDGEQAAHYSLANTYRTQASRAAIEGDALGILHTQLFGVWLQARARNEDALAAFFEARFPPEFRPAFNAWMAEKPFTNPAASPSPFVMPLYRRPGHDRADAFDAKAEEAYKVGQYANGVSDAFEQGATVLAAALFFGGIGQVFKQRSTRIILLTVACVALVVGLLRLFSLPMQILGVHPLH
jgi:hypothetical protein